MPLEGHSGEEKTQGLCYNLQNLVICVLSVFFAFKYMTEISLSHVSVIGQRAGGVPIRRHSLITASGHPFWPPFKFLVNIPSSRVHATG